MSRIPTAEQYEQEIARLQGALVEAKAQAAAAAAQASASVVADAAKLTNIAPSLSPRQRILVKGLSGQAADWWNWYESSRDLAVLSFTVIEADFKAFFLPAGHIARARKEWHALEHKAGHLIDHVNKFRSLLLEIPDLTEQDKFGELRDLFDVKGCETGRRVDTLGS